MLICLLWIAGAVVLLPLLYLAHVWWAERHPRYPVWPDDGPATCWGDHDDFLGIGS